MDYNNSDVIVARATPIGNAALALIRFSGDAIANHVSLFFSVKLFYSTTGNSLFAFCS